MGPVTETPRRAHYSLLALFAGGAVAGAVLGGAIAASAASGGAAASAASGGTASGSGAVRPDRHHVGLGFGSVSFGTVTAVGAASVTIRTSTGSATYGVDGNSDIDKNGESTLADLAVGDAVRFVLRPGTTTIAVLHAGDEAKNRPAGAPPAGAPGAASRPGHGPCPDGHGDGDRGGAPGGTARTPTTPSVTPSSGT
jgi:hypothetical protein